MDPLWTEKRVEVDNIGGSSRWPAFRSHTQNSVERLRDLCRRGQDSHRARARTYNLTRPLTPLHPIFTLWQQLRHLAIWHFPHSGSHQCGSCIPTWLIPELKLYRLLHGKCSVKKWIQLQLPNLLHANLLSKGLIILFKWFKPPLPQPSLWWSCAQHSFAMSSIVHLIYLKVQISGVSLHWKDFAMSAGWDQKVLLTWILMGQVKLLT